jgi:type VI secretion system protein ImpG
MRVPLGLPVATFAPDKLRLYLTGEARTALTLLQMLHERTESIVLMESLSTGVKEREIPLGRKALTWAGFGDDEALLPFPRAAFPGFRLLSEYYALPQKFCFLDIAGVGRVAELDPAIDRFAVAFRFDAPLPAGTRVAKDALKLHCVPVVNIFSTTADPIRLSTQREEYLVRPAGLGPVHGEVYAVTRVQGLARGSSKRFDVSSFYDFSHLGSSRQDQFFYSLHLRPSVVGEGADLMMSFSTPEDAGIPPEVDVISVDMLATNRQHAAAVRAGELKEPTASSPAICTFKNLGAVTPHVPPPLGRELQWRVVAHATMNLRSLTETEVLRAALDVYNLHGLVDRQAARANELRLAALKDIRLSAAERVWRGTAVRGVGIDIDLDEKGFDGDGDLFLFGAILDRFFANYVSLNSFSRTTVHGVQSKLKFAWPPRSGNLTLL